MSDRTPRTRQRARTRDWRPAFLEALKRTGMVSTAADAAGVGRRTAYDHRQRDQDFAHAWDDILDEALEEMEREAYRRAVDGVERPVFHAGQEVGAIREYSDALLMFMLRSRKPEKYSERYRIEHSGRLEAPRPVLNISDPEVRARSRDLLHAVANARKREQIPQETPVKLDLKALSDEELDAMREAAIDAGEIVE